MLADAIRQFWHVRQRQASQSSVSGQGNRGAVTGGKQLDGMLQLFCKAAEDAGVPPSCIFTRKNHLPGYFRPSKDWDFLIVSPRNQLIAAIELKSQVGSFGNNFNNRAEEAIGNAVDLWTAFREQVFEQSQAPWVGYLMLVEKNASSTRAVRPPASLFPYSRDFESSSYLDRYAILCRKLLRERHYTAASLIWTTPEIEYGFPESSLSFDAFLLSFIGFIQGMQQVFRT